MGRRQLRFGLKRGTFRGPEVYSRMIEPHQLSVTVEPDGSKNGRFKWTLFKAGKMLGSSTEPYASKREATIAAAKVLERQISSWQALGML